MDPNEALAQLHEQMKPEPHICTESGSRLHQFDRDLACTYCGFAPLTVLAEIATLFEGLDEWLSRDGFLPSDWQSDEEKADPGFNDRNALIVAALRELPWGEDVDINGGDLVDLVGQLLAADGRDTLTALKERAKQDFNDDEDDWTPPPRRPGDACQLGPAMGLITHRRWGTPEEPQPGDCDEYEDGVITDAATGRVVGHL